MNKKCVYTCITGDYDSLKDVKFKEKDIDYICFTNNKELQSKSWEIKYINEDIDNLLLARKIKILSYRYLKEYDFTIWIDGAISIIQPLSKFLNECCDLKKYDMIGFKHQIRDSIYDEINACVYLNKETPENGIKVENFLKREKYPNHDGLIESTVLIRKNNKAVNQLMKMWYEMVTNYSRRDQLSFNYCLWKHPIKINFLNMYVFNNPYFVHDLHNKNNKKNMRLYFGQFADHHDFDYHKCMDIPYTYEQLEKGIEFKIKEDADVIEIILDENGNNLRHIEISPKVEFRISSELNLGDYKLINNNAKIMLYGKFKKNKKYQIIIDIEPINTEKHLESINNLTAKLQEFDASIQDKNSLIKELNMNIERLKSELDSTKNTNIILNSELNDIKNSKSWNITRPLRRLAKIIRGVKNERK